MSTKKQNKGRRTKAQVPTLSPELKKALDEYVRDCAIPANQLRWWTWSDVAEVVREHGPHDWHAIEEQRDCTWQLEDGRKVKLAGPVGDYTAEQRATLGTDSSIVEYGASGFNDADRALCEAALAYVRTGGSRRSPDSLVTAIRRRR